MKWWAKCLSFETLAAGSSCELGVPFQGTPRVHLGIPHMNFGGPTNLEILEKSYFAIKSSLFQSILGKRGPQSSCGGESPHELGGSPERERLIHM